MVRCIEGEVLYVAVDIRRGSPTYEKHVAVKIIGENKKQLFVPRGFTHGFAVLSETSVFAYKVDNRYASEYDGGIIWNDAALKIDWNLPGNEIKLSDKDAKLSTLASLDNPFMY